MSRINSLPSQANESLIINIILILDSYNKHKRKTHSGYGACYYCKAVLGKPSKKREYIRTSDLKEGGGQFENPIFT